MPETIAIASDHAGVTLKETLKAQIAARGMLVEDMGTRSTDSVDYPDFARQVSQWVLAQSGRRGVLICGSGIGMSMAANRYMGIRAALCRTAHDAEMARKHNDANVLCLGERVTGTADAQEIVQVFLDTEFEGGRHQARVDKLG